MAGISDVVVPELLALTGEVVSKVRGWLATNPAFPAAVPSRPAFTEAWRQRAGKPFPEETRRCRLGSRPLYCRLRYRALGFNLIPTTGEEDRQRFLLLAVYEGCTGLLYYELFEDLGAEGNREEDQSPVGLSVPRFLTFHTTAARWVGLPIQRVLLTNRFLLDGGGAALSQDAIRDQLATGGMGQELGIVIADQLPKRYPPAALPSSIGSTRVLRRLDRFVNDHNAANAIAQVRAGRKALKRLAFVPPPADGIPVLRGLDKNERRLRIETVASAVPLGKLRLHSTLQEIDVSAR